MVQQQEDANTSPKLELYDKGAVVQLVNELSKRATETSSFAEVHTSEGRKKVLERIGVRADTGDAYRLAYYEDSVQRLLLVGELRGDGGVTFARSIRVRADRPPESGKRSNAIEESADGRVVTALISGDVRNLPRPIALMPTEIAINKKADAERGDPSETVTLTKSAARQLETDATVLARADSAVDALRDLGEHGATSSLPIVRVGRPVGRAT